MKDFKEEEEVKPIKVRPKRVNYKIYKIKECATY